MKTVQFNEITLMQFICLSFGLQISVGLLALPQALAEKSGTDGWISILIGWLISTAAGLIIVQVMKNHPEGTLFDLLTRYFGRWVGKAAAAAFAFYIFFYGYTSLVRTVLYMKIWLLPQTPAFVTVMLLLLPIYAIARSGVRILGRYAELIIFISFWIPFVYLYTLKGGHWLHLAPVLKQGWQPVISGTSTVVLSYSGLGALFVLYPFLRNKRLASAGIVISNTISMLIFILVTIACFVYFSPDEIKEYNEPVVNVLKTIEFKFIERVEILFIAFYLFTFSLCWIPALFMCVLCTSWLMGKPDHRAHLRLLLPIIAVGSFMFLPTFNQNDRMEHYLSIMAISLELVLPIGLLIYLWGYKHVQRRKNG
ncbi:MAG: spore gernimation protein [Paenibacillus sp.]|nr:spore gernimation protein [Paenibacillus sp.]